MAAAGLSADPLRAAAQVVALMTRGEKLEGELRTAQHRETVLAAELEAAKRAGLRSPTGGSARMAPAGG